MTPAQVWGNAYIKHYLETLNWLRSQGFELYQKVIDGETHTPITVKAYCQKHASDFAEDTRNRWVAANGWTL